MKENQVCEAGDRKDSADVWSLSSSPQGGKAALWVY